MCLFLDMLSHISIIYNQLSPPLYIGTVVFFPFIFIYFHSHWLSISFVPQVTNYSPCPSLYFWAEHLLLQYPVVFCSPWDMQWKTHTADKVLPIQAGQDWHAKWWVLCQMTGKEQGENWKWAAKDNHCNCLVYAFSQSSLGSQRLRGDSRWCLRVGGYLCLLPCQEVTSTDIFWLAPRPHCLFNYPQKPLLMGAGEFQQPVLRDLVWDTCDKITSPGLHWAFPHSPSSMCHTCSWICILKLLHSSLYLESVFSA